jgi:hypothetical protein
MLFDNWGMSTGNEFKPEIVNPTLPFSEAMNGLLALTQLLASLRTPEGTEPGQSPMIVLTANGVEMRMADVAPFAKSAQPVVSEAQQQWFRKIEEGLESVRQATAALSATLAENAKNVDQTLATHSAAIETVRTALTQNEQLIESMVELMGPSEFNLPNPEELANIS